MRISKDKKIEDWLEARKILLKSSDKALWADTYHDFFHARLESRYLKPILNLQKSGSLDGEGFSIVAIQCSLVEFLESTYQGISYKYLKNGERLGKYEYSKSSIIFKSFLTKRTPFKSQFNESLSEEFYVSIRCGVLHEAATKNGWKIRASSSDSLLVNGSEKILYRDNFQNALIEYASIYGNELIESVELQKAFIRKFDYLCDL